jgi:hypothetical protein
MAFKSLLDPTFKYRKAVSTDVRKTFRRIKREQKKARGQAAGEAARGSLRQRRGRE